MEETRPPSHLYRHPRRSTPALHHLKVAPLSPSYVHPSDDTGVDDESDERGLRVSYIQGKSAPTTPGILSRTSSRARLAANANANANASLSPYVHEGYVTSEGLSDSIPKAKSYSVLQPGPHHSGSRRSHHDLASIASPLSRVDRPARTNKPDPSDNWLHRAGVALATEARESKGQSWLAHRESSTSLVSAEDLADESSLSRQTSNERYYNRSSRVSFDNDEGLGSMTPRWSASRGGSKPVSARASRRGSKAGSRVELLGMTAGGSRASDIAVVEEDYFLHAAGRTSGPDFVDAADAAELKPPDNGAEAEEEVAQLAQETGFGLGGWVDRLIGSTLFRVREDGEDSDEEEQEGDAEKGEEDLKRRRRSESERVVASSIPAAPGQLSRNDEAGSADHAKKETGEEPSGWQDAAWLLSVASKVIL